MAYLHPIKCSKRAHNAMIKLCFRSTSAMLHNFSPFQLRSLATVGSPDTGDLSTAKGPTAIVFMNMGGPSTTDEVGDFLSRLFVG